MKKMMLAVIAISLVVITGCTNNESLSNIDTVKVEETTESEDLNASIKESSESNKISVEASNTNRREVVTPIELGFYPTDIDYSKLKAYLAYDSGNIITVVLESDKPVRFDFGMIWMDLDKNKKLEVEKDEYGGIASDNKLDNEAHYNRSEGETEFFVTQIVLGDKQSKEDLYWVDGTPLNLKNDTTEALKMMADNMYYITDTNGNFGTSYYINIPTKVFESDRKTRQRRFYLTNKEGNVPNKYDSMAFECIDIDGNLIDLKDIEDLDEIRHADLDIGEFAIEFRFDFEDSYVPDTEQELIDWIKNTLKIKSIRWKIDAHTFEAPIMDFIITEDK